jgi:mandelate racemase
VAAPAQPAAGPGAGLVVRDVAVRAVVVPLRRPLATRVGDFPRWPLLLIDVTTEQGITGHSYLAPYLDRAAAALLPAVRDLGGGLRGRPVAPAAAFEQARGWFGLAGYQGLALAAVAGLDIALWDALAKAAGLPLVRLLGGTLAPVRAYNSNGLGLIPPAAAGDEALELLAEGGFTALKVRVGRDNPADDLAAVRRVRDAAGDGVTLVADYNQGLARGEALRRCRALDAEGLAWIEEPLRYDDLDGHAGLARDIATPVMLGENFYGPRAMLAAIRAQACDLVMPDLMRIGGVAGFLQAAAIADACGIRCPRTCTRRSPATCCASRRPGSGWSGRTGRTRCWRTRSRSAPASCTCPMSPATAWNGTRTPWPTTRPGRPPPKGELGPIRSAPGAG